MICLNSYTVQLLAKVTVALKLSYYYYIRYFWRYLVAIQTEGSLLTAKNRQ